MLGHPPGKYGLQFTLLDDHSSGQEWFRGIKPEGGNEGTPALTLQRPTALFRLDREAGSPSRYPGSPATKLEHHSGPQGEVSRTAN